MTNQEVMDNTIVRYALLELVGIHFLPGDIENKITKFTIPESSDIDKSTIKELCDIKYDINTQEGLIEFAKEEGIKITKASIKYMITLNDEDELLEEEDYEEFTNELLENMKFLCKVREGDNWTFEKGKEAMHEYCKKAKESLGFKEV